MFDQSAAEIGNRFEGVVDADTVFNEGGPATVVVLLKLILLELRMLRAAGCEPESGNGG